MNGVGFGMSFVVIEKQFMASGNSLLRAKLDNRRRIWRHTQPGTHIRTVGMIDHGRDTADSRRVQTCFFILGNVGIVNAVWCGVALVSLLFCTKGDLLAEVGEAKDLSFAKRAGGKQSLAVETRADTDAQIGRHMFSTSFESDHVDPRAAGMFTYLLFHGCDENVTPWRAVVVSHLKVIDEIGIGVDARRGRRFVAIFHIWIAGTQYTLRRH